jgi:flagellar basal-body rod protein FlgB
VSFLGDHTGDVLSVAMIGASARQRVLANNLANADTPGYARMDVSFEGALADAVREDGRRGSPLGSDPRFADVDARLSRSRESAVTQPLSGLEGSNGLVLRVDGSNVDPDQEMAELSANQLAYDTVTGLLRKRLGTLRTAMSAA